MTSQSADDLVRRLCEETDALYKAAELARTKTNRATTATIERLQRELSDYKEVIEDKRRICREIEVAMYGDRAAKQPSLCDIQASVLRELDLAWSVIERYGVPKGRGKTVSNAIEVLVTRMDRELAARDKTIETLKRYANHQGYCPVMHWMFDEFWPSWKPLPECTCGYAAIDAARSEGGSHE